MTEASSGTPTFLFTDVEGSTRLLRRLGDRYGAVIAEHGRLLREACASHRGHQVDSQGDSFFFAFARPRDALLAAVAAQRSLRARRWPPGSEVRVRIGIHTGPAEFEDGRYVGLSVHRTARICAVGHGGQILVSQSTVAMLEDEGEALAELELRDLGELRLKDFDRPVRIFDAVAPGLAVDLPAPSGASRSGPAPAGAERERTLAALGEQVAGGRLTLQEFCERSEAALAASSVAELQRLRLDVAEPARERRPPRPKRFVWALLGDTERSGRWRLARSGLACVLFGNADLDLRRTQLDGALASLTAVIFVGNLDIYVPEGIEVDVGGLAVLGHRRQRGGTSPPHQGAPLLRIRIVSFGGTADVWHLPASMAGRSFDDASAALESKLDRRRGESTEHGGSPC
jgi:class 3 adenylate cyclase